MSRRCITPSSGSVPTRTSASSVRTRRRSRSASQRAARVSRSSSAGSDRARAAALGIVAFSVFMLAGRVITGLNVLNFVGAFLAQWGVGVVIGLWPAAADGRAPIAAYQTAFAVAKHCSETQTGALWHVQGMPRLNGHSSAGNYRFDLEQPDPILSLGESLGLPATDVVRFGCEPIVDAVLEERRRMGEGAED